jgi:hypothetical protein
MEDGEVMVLGWWRIERGWDEKVVWLMAWLEGEDV